MVRACSPLLAIFAVLLTGCSDLRPIEAVPGQSWALAKKQAYSGPARLHKVVRGDTASMIAQRYGVTLRELAAANDLRKPYVVVLGSNLTIPQPGGSTAPAAKPARSKRPAIRELPAPESPMAPKEAPSEIQVAALAAPDATPPAPVPVPAPAAEPDQVAQLPVTAPGAMARAAAMKPHALSGDGFLWPASGTVVSRFGKKQDGSQNDGINLAAPLGSPVLAAENGVVSYASDEIAGWGRMILIRHADGFTTGYAHLDSILTNVGDQVTRGQVIGRVGQTGYVDTPQLHFELRSGKRALDPSRHLVKGEELEVASR